MLTCCSNDGEVPQPLTAVACLAATMSHNPHHPTPPAHTHTASDHDIHAGVHSARLRPVAALNIGSGDARRGFLLQPSPAADGRHLDAYDSHAAQYWPALRLFLSTLGPAQPLPPAAEEGTQGSALQQLLQPQLRKELQPPQEQEMVLAAAGAAGGVGAEARKER